MEKREILSSITCTASLGQRKGHLEWVARISQSCILPLFTASFQSHSEGPSTSGGFLEVLIKQHPAEGSTALSKVPNVGTCKAWIFLILKNPFLYFCRLLALLVLRCQAAHSGHKLAWLFHVRRRCLFPVEIKYASRPPTTET